MFEKIFSKVSRFHRQRRQHALQKLQDPYRITFKEEETVIKLFSLNALTSLQVVQESVGVVYSDTIVLPSEMCCFNDRTLNRELYLHKALVAGVISKYNIQSKLDNSASILERCLEIQNSQVMIQDYLSKEYPNYSSWSQKLLQQWQDHLSKNSKLAIPARPLVMPQAALAPWCELLRKKSSVLWNELTDGSSSDAKETKTVKERQKPRASTHQKTKDRLKQVDLEKESKNHNPVAHSFEKLETLDDYQGGHRQVDGADELSQHEEALNELDLQAVTRGGDTTSSVYQIDHYQDQDFFHSALQASTEGKETRSIKESFNVTLPEWDFQHHHYRPDYCHLTVQREDPLPTNSSIQAATLTARDILFEKNRPLIEHWRQQFDRLINRRTWMDRQWEGPDFSLDDFVRYYADTTSHHTGDPRVYLKSLPAISDQVTQVIVDQSLSTDSYVMNRRVLDVSLESLQLMSLLFEKTAHPLSIAGVYSHTHRHCSFRLYKDFEDPWSVFLNQIPTIEPQGYTRLGPSLRYATERLLKRKEKFKLILLLTDGKPTDYDLYEGRYGLEDIRQAQREARQSGIHFRAMAIEKQAQHYFPRLFGKNEFFILNDPQFFPEELFKVYWNCWSR